MLGGLHEWVTCFVGFLDSRATIVLLGITLLVFLKERQCVFCEEGTKFLSAYEMYVKYMIHF
jgi:hypothetical protein